MSFTTSLIRRLAVLERETRNYKEKPVATQRTAPLVFIGVDPGAVGGIAVICGQSASAITMPRSERALWDYVSKIVPDPKGVVGAMEQVGGFIKENPAPGSAMFSFGESYGEVKMALVASGLSITKGDVGPGDLYLVPPQEWQRGLGIDPRRKSEGDTDWKNRLKHNAEVLFPKKQHPTMRITLRVADALLIAAYIKRKYTTG